MLTEREIVNRQIEKMAGVVTDDPSWTEPVRRAVIAAAAAYCKAIEVKGFYNSGVQRDYNLARVVADGDTSPAACAAWGNVNFMWGSNLDRMAHFAARASRHFGEGDLGGAADCAVGCQAYVWCALEEEFKEMWWADASALSAARDAAKELLRLVRFSEYAT